MTSSASDDATGNTTAYVLSSVSVDPAAVDVDGGTASVTLTTVANDDRDPDLIRWIWDLDGDEKDFYEDDPSAMYYSDAGLHYTIDFYKGAKPGLYKLAQIEISSPSTRQTEVLYCSYGTADCDYIHDQDSDCCDDEKNVIFTDLSGGDITVTSSAPDVTAPVLSSVSCDPAAVDVDGGTATVAVTGVVSDESPGSFMWCRWSTPGNIELSVDAWVVDVVLGSSLTFFRGSVPGLYQLCGCMTIDMHDNYHFYQRPAPAGCGFDDEPGDDKTVVDLSACGVRCPGFLRTRLMCKTR